MSNVCPVYGNKTSTEFSDLPSMTLKTPKLEERKKHCKTVQCTQTNMFHRRDCDGLLIIDSNCHYIVTFYEFCWSLHRTILLTGNGPYGRSTRTCVLDSSRSPSEHGKCYSVAFRCSVLATLFVLASSTITDRFRAGNMWILTFARNCALRARMLFATKRHVCVCTPTLPLVVPPWAVGRKRVWNWPMRFLLRQAPVYACCGRG